MRLKDGEQIRELLVRTTPQGGEVQVDGRSVRLRVHEVRPGRYLVQQGERLELLHCVRDGSVIHLSWRGVVYRLTEEREGARASERGAAGGLQAPMPGKVIAVRVRVGEEVAKGQELLVVEAMKMENALRAPRAGRVKSVLASVGEMVSPGAMLVELE